MEFNNLLVPVDLTPISEELFQQALQLVSGENPVIILLHAIDPGLVDFASAHEFGEHDQIVAKMRERAQQELERLRESASSEVEVEIIVAEGPPFLQIIQKAQEFLADAIVMGRLGGARMDKLLFGSTAEKVLRATSRPVIVLPIASAD
jgi:nucleotide-binding universal stress UspA family protein